MINRTNAVNYPESRKSVARLMVLQPRFPVNKQSSQGRFTNAKIFSLKFNRIAKGGAFRLISDADRSSSADFLSALSIDAKEQKPYFTIGC